MLAQAAAQRPNRPASQPKSAIAEGQKVFGSSCVSCHGLDGRGSERAPNIAERREIQRLSDAEIMHIVQEGVAGTGMPAFHSLAIADVKAVVAYLRILQGSGKTVKLPGDPEQGKTDFFGKAGCSECHMVAGSGGFIASDLSGYARNHSVEDIRNALATTGQNADQAARTATATTLTGDKYVGRVRNEDNFSLQLQTPDGAFHFLLKSDLKPIEYGPAFLATDHGSRLNPKELDDLISFLIDSSKASEKIPEHRDDD